MVGAAQEKEVDREKLLKKVRDLLALANHPNTGEHEATLAAERAQDILLKYNLDMMEVTDVSFESPVTKLNYTIDGNFMWKKVLAAAVAKANFCDAYQTPSETKLHVMKAYGGRARPARNAMNIVGRYENVAVVRELLSWLMAQCERIATRETSLYRGLAPKARFRNNFLHGMTQRIAVRLAEAQLAAQVDQNVRAVVVHHEKEIKDFYATEGIKLVTTTGHTTRGSVGFVEGLRAGDKVNLHRPSQSLRNSNGGLLN